jgi:CheY-like chemotaxis protein
MNVSILVVDDEPDVADLFRQRFRRESRQGTFVMHFATSGAEALDRLAEEIEPTLGRCLVRYQHAGYGRVAIARRNQAASARSARHDGNRLWR